MNSTELTLKVLDAQSGCKKSFAYICENYYKPSFRFAMKLSKHPDLAKDITQEAWTTVAKDIKSLKEPSVFKAWLFRIIYRRFIDTQRKHKLQSLEDNAVPEPYQEEESEELDISRYINQLPENERYTVYLFYFEQMSLSEIAVVSNVAVGTVKSRLFRARAQLSNWLNEDEVRK